MISARDHNQGRVPIRTCVGCGQKAPRLDLLRLARAEGGGVIVDIRRRAPGRGANVCPAESCLKAALDKGRLDRALRTRTTEMERNRLVAEFNALSSMNGEKTSRGRYAQD